MAYVRHFIIVFAAMQFALPVCAEPYSDFVRSSIYVPVRDGTKLAVNIYRPAEGAAVATDKLPVIFVFTPYRSRFFDEKGVVQHAALREHLALRQLLRAGYVVAVADIRGKGASFGQRRGFQDRTEAMDGRDLVEWLAKQDYSTGKVGMIGCSYLGGTTMHTASTAPPSLKAVFIGASELDKYAFVRNGGITAQFNTRPDEKPEIDLASVPVDADPDGVMLRAAVAEHQANTPMGPLWYGMPYRDSISAFTNNAFWEEVAAYRFMDAVRDAGIATYFWGNWHDEPTGQVILAAANIGGKFIAGPGDHCVPPKDFDFSGEVVRYFDHHLKGADNGIDREPLATYWVAGQNEYERSDQLPGVRSHPLPMFLSASSGPASHSLNQGSMGIATAESSGIHSFTVDYNLPSAEYFAFWAKPMNEHGLSYTGAPLKGALKLVGFPVARLTVKTDQPDADLWVYLDRIATDGSTEVISFGRLKISHRALSRAPYDTLGLPYHSGLERAVSPPAAGEWVPVSIAMTPISRVVPDGVRLRLTIAGADPRQRNLADIKLDPAPQISVKYGGFDASRLDLPLAE